MRPCEKCRQNKWNYSYSDQTGWVVAVCKNCGYDVSFPSRRHYKIMSGQPIGTNIRVEFKVDHGKIYRKEKDGFYHEIYFKKENKGIGLASFKEVL